MSWAYEANPHNQQLARRQLEEFQDLAVQALDQADLEDDPQLRLLLLDWAGWLRTRANRLSLWPAGSAAKITINRTRLLLLRFERSLSDLAGRRAPKAIHEQAVRLAELLTAQREREVYEDLVMVLRELASRARESGHKQESSHYTEMAQKLETRLEGGQLESLTLSQQQQDRELLKGFEEKLVELYPELSPVAPPSVFRQRD
ncbi:MAG: hypothetical protein AB7S38_06065 [Vulcanimicrobiota bacterium]